MRSEKRVARSEKWVVVMVMAFALGARGADEKPSDVKMEPVFNGKDLTGWTIEKPGAKAQDRSEEHTSELQSH